MSNDFMRFLRFSRQFDRFYQRSFSSMLERTHLSMREMHVLLFLANNQGYDTARDIAEYRSLSKSQISQAVDLLAAEGLLERRPDEHDRRIVHLTLTDLAQPLAKEAQEIQARCARRLLDGLTDEQQEEWKILMETIMKNGAHLAEEEQ